MDEIKYGTHFCFPWWVDFLPFVNAASWVDICYVTCMPDPSEMWIGWGRDPMAAVKSLYSVPRRLESCIIQEPCPGHSQLSRRLSGKRQAVGQQLAFHAGTILPWVMKAFLRTQRDREKEPFVFPHVADKRFRSSKEIHKWQNMGTPLSFTHQISSVILVLQNTLFQSGQWCLWSCLPLPRVSMERKWINSNEGSCCLPPCSKSSQESPIFNFHFKEIEARQIYKAGSSHGHFVSLIMLWHF